MTHVHAYTDTLHTKPSCVLKPTTPYAADEACTGNLCTYIHPLPALNNYL